MQHDMDLTFATFWNIFGSRELHHNDVLIAGDLAYMIPCANAAGSAIAKATALVSLGFLVMEVVKKEKRRGGR